MKKINLYLLTGFLGSGKTTFLSNILEDRTLENKKVSVIMNEFGKIGVDGSIIKKEDIELLEINRGSIFCSCLQLNFVSALNEMADREMDYVFVESSGLADPSNIGDFLEAVKISRGDVYNYSGAICIVDGVNFLEQVSDLETVKRQLKYCHLAIVSKIDLIDDAKLKVVKDEIIKINPNVKILTAIDGRIDYNFLDEDIVGHGWTGSEDTTNTPDSKPKTFTLTYPDKLSKKDIINFLDDIKNLSYRIKGFLNIDGDLTQIDVVSQIIDFKKYDKIVSENQLVIISKIGNDIIKPVFNAWEKNIGTEMKLR